MISGRKILKWQCFGLNVATQTPHHYAEAVVQAIQQHIVPDIPAHGTRTVHVVIEAQFMFKRGTPNFATSTTVNSVVQGCFHAALLVDGRIDHVHAMRPAEVSNHFQLPAGYRKKKSAAVKLVRGWLKSTESPVTIDETQQRDFIGQLKKDDLADALLQAITYRDRNLIDAWNPNKTSYYGTKVLLT